MAGFTGATGRTAQFTTGITGDPGSAAGVQSEIADTDRFNAMVPHQFRPSSVLTPIMKNPGGLGMSTGDAARRTADGTYLGSVNGTSASSFEPSALLRLSEADSK
jgi:hypothetical protein